MSAARRTMDHMDVTLRRWDAGDRPLLDAFNTPEMTTYLGGPEESAQLDDRQARYERLMDAGEARMFRIDVDGAAAGGIGYWMVDHGGREAFETGWQVLPTFQGRGVAGAALRSVIAEVRADGRRDLLVAYPGPTTRRRTPCAPGPASCRPARDPSRGAAASCTSTSGSWSCGVRRSESLRDPLPRARLRCRRGGRTGTAGRPCRTARRGAMPRPPPSTAGCRTARPPSPSPRRSGRRAARMRSRPSWP